MGTLSKFYGVVKVYDGGGCYKFSLMIFQYSGEIFCP